MNIRIGNDICLYVNLLGNKNLDAVNINSIEAFLINTTKWQDLMDEQYRESALMQDEYNCRRDRIRFVSRFPVEPHFHGFHATPYDICCTGHPCYHQHPIPYIPIYHGYGVHPHTFERGCYGPCAWHTNHPHCCEPHTWACDDMHDVIDRAGVKYMDMQRQYDRCRFLAPVEATDSKNKVKVYFPAQAQIYTGTYKLVIVAKVYEPGYCKDNLRTITVDYENVFTLVNSSDQGCDGNITIHVGSSKYYNEDIRQVHPGYDNYTMVVHDELNLGEADYTGNIYKLIIGLKDGSFVLYNPGDWEFGSISFESIKPDEVTVNQYTGKLTSLKISDPDNLPVIKVYDYQHTEMTSFTVNVVEEDHTPQPVYPTSISINGPERVKKGASATTYTVTIMPPDADTDTAITWTKNGVGNIVNGAYSSNETGTCTITATTANGKSASKTIEVYEDAPTPVTKYTLTYKDGSTTLGTQQYEAGATITPITSPTKDGYTFAGWNGLPNIMPANDLTVTAKWNENVTPQPEPELSLNRTSLNIAVGESGTVRAIISNIAQSNLVWGISPEGIATINVDSSNKECTVTGISVGTTTVTCSYGVGGTLRRTCTINVTEGEQPPQEPEYELRVSGTGGHTYDGDRIVLRVGENANIVAKIVNVDDPTDTKEEEISWSASSNAVTVDPTFPMYANVIGVEATNNVTVTATSASGLTGSISFKVNEAEYDLSLDPAQLLMLVGDNPQGISAIRKTNGIVNTTGYVSWSSSDNNIATVDNGYVTAVGVGNATVTATWNLPTDETVATATCAVEVTQNHTQPQSVTITCDQYEIVNGRVEIPAGTQNVVFTAVIAPSDADINTNITWEVLDGVGDYTTDGNRFTYSALNRSSICSVKASTQNDLHDQILIDVVAEEQPEPTKSWGWLQNPMTVRVGETVYGTVVHNGYDVDAAEFQIQYPVVSGNADGVISIDLSYPTVHANEYDRNFQIPITGLDVGTQKIRAKISGRDDIYEDLTVNVIAPVATLTISGPDTIAIGGNAEYETTISIEGGSNAANWSNGSPSIIDFVEGAAQGIAVTGLAEGTATITATSINYPGIVATKTITVGAAVEEPEPINYSINVVEPITNVTVGGDPANVRFYVLPETNDNRHWTYFVPNVGAEGIHGESLNEGRVNIDPANAANNPDGITYTVYGIIATDNELSNAGLSWETWTVNDWNNTTLPKASNTFKVVTFPSEEEPPVAANKHNLIFYDTGLQEDTHALDYDGPLQRDTLVDVYYPNTWFEVGRAEYTAGNPTSDPTLESLIATIDEQTVKDTCLLHGIDRSNYRLSWDLGGYYYNWPDSDTYIKAVWSEIT